MPSSPYQVTLRPAAQRDLDRLPNDVAQRVLGKLVQLRENARPRGVKKLVGTQNEWRLRVGEYRMLYEIDRGGKTIRIFRIRHRREVYR